MRRIVIASVAAIGMAGCAGRAPNPISAYQPTDQQISCEAIAAEMSGNEALIARLEGEKGDKVAQNVIAGAAGVVFILPLFLMDFQDAPGVEQEAVKRRQQALWNLSITKKCAEKGIKVYAPSVPSSVQRRLEDAEASGATPACKDVGGYEAYMEKTGKVCTL